MFLARIKHRSSLAGKGLKGIYEMATNDFGLRIMAFLIGSEISEPLIHRMGYGLVIIIHAESLGAFLLVLFLLFGYGTLSFSSIYFALAVALVFAAMAPASAPAGTVAVIHECKTNEE